MYNDSSESTNKFHPNLSTVLCLWNENSYRAEIGITSRMKFIKNRRLYLTPGGFSLWRHRLNLRGVHVGLWWPKWHRGGLSPRTSGFPDSLHFLSDPYSAIMRRWYNAPIWGLGTEGLCLNPPLQMKFMLDLKLSWMKGIIFLVVTLCSSERIQLFGGIFYLHFQGRKVSQGRNQ